MPYTEINVGAAPDDNTGDPIRTAFQKVNEQFQELFTAVGASATQEALTLAISNWSSAVGELNEALSGKASTSDLAGKAALTQIVRRDLIMDPVVSKEERLNQALNGGHLVSFCYRLIDDGQPIVPGEWLLPPLPQAFYLHDIVLIFGSSEGGQITASFNTTTNVASWTSADVPVGGPVKAVDPGYSLKDIPAFTPMNFHLSSFVQGYNAGQTYQLDLWLRGVWAP